MEGDEQIMAFTEKQVLKGQWQGDDCHAPESVKLNAAELLRQYNATALWMRRYADAAALAANVCPLILH
jgi:hypothetical protein